MTGFTTPAPHVSKPGFAFKGSKFKYHLETAVPNTREKAGRDHIESACLSKCLASLVICIVRGVAFPGESLAGQSSEDV